MDRSITVLGVDPGKTTGLALVHWTPGEGWVLLDCTETNQGPHDTNARIRQDLADTASFHFPVKYIAAERFVEGPKSSKLKHGDGGAKARNILGGLQTLDTPVILLAAAMWKPWMTAARWAALGFEFPKTKNNNDHKSAAGVAVYSMVRRGFAPDPLRR